MKNIAKMPDTKWIVIGIVTIVAIVTFHEPMSHLIYRITSAEISKNTDGSITVKLKAAISLTQATIQSNSERQNANAQLSTEDIDEIIKEAEGTKITNLSEKNLLWIDDNPSNVRYEINTFSQLGISVIQARNGKEALEIIKSKSIDVIISDFKRDNDTAYTGYGLFDELKNQNIKIPYIFYSARTKPEHVIASKERGAVTQTNRPLELYNAVMTSII
jgi:CheY-like chemotaxis protein